MRWLLAPFALVTMAVWALLCLYGVLLFAGGWLTYYVACEILHALCTFLDRLGRRLP